MRRILLLKLWGRRMISLLIIGQSFDILTVLITQQAAIKCVWFGWSGFVASSGVTN